MSKPRDESALVKDFSRDLMKADRVEAETFEIDRITGHILLAEWNKSRKRTKETISVLEMTGKVIKQLREELYTRERQGWNAALETAARIVCPVPHIEEERSCKEIAQLIRFAKKQ